MQRMNKALYLVLFVFTLGFCFDAAPLMSDIPLVWKIVVGALALFRLLAIVGVISQKHGGWLIAMGFCALWIILHVLTLDGDRKVAAVAGFLFPAGCLLILTMTKDDFS